MMLVGILSITVIMTIGIIPMIAIITARVLTNGLGPGVSRE